MSNRRLAGGACVAWAVVCAAGTVALADEGRISLKPRQSVLMPGESTGVDAWARLPASGFAFASAEFDVEASMPGWSFARAGAIAGADVLGISAWQTHNPFGGPVADPSNPKRVWTGGFTPASYDPALVKFEPVISGMSYYPSPLTPWAVPLDPKPDRGPAPC